MPVYEYKCTVCQDRFEVEQSIRDAALTTMSGDDHEHQLKKVFSPVGISFRGGGFYRNEARSASPKSSDASTTSESTSTGTTSGDKAASSGAKADKAASSGTKADTASTSKSTSTTSD